MKIVIAIDSFKGSLSSRAAGEAVERAIDRVTDNTDIQIFPLADGGEGTVEALAEGLHGEIIKTQVTDLSENRSRQTMRCFLMVLQ